MLIDRPPSGRMDVDPQLRDAYERDGFAVVRELVPAAELARIRTLYDDLFETRAGWERGDFFDMLDPEDRPEASRS